MLFGDDPPNVLQFQNIGATLLVKVSRSNSAAPANGASRERYMFRSPVNTVQVGDGILSCVFSPGRQVSVLLLIVFVARLCSRDGSYSLRCLWFSLVPASFPVAGSLEVLYVYFCVRLYAVCKGSNGKRLGWGGKAVGVAEFSLQLVLVAVYHGKEVWLERSASYQESIHVGKSR